MAKGDVKLLLGSAPVIFLSGQTLNATTEGNNAAWHCNCVSNTLLLGRCYSQFGHDCHTTCPDCGKKYRVNGNQSKQAIQIVEY